jgi:hypothetical protein
MKVVALPLVAVAPTVAVGLAPAGNCAVVASVPETGNVIDVFPVTVRVVVNAPLVVNAPPNAIAFPPIFETVTDMLVVPEPEASPDRVIVWLPVM